jgi:hypothetical protein
MKLRAALLFVLFSFSSLIAQQPVPGSPQRAGAGRTTAEPPVSPLQTARQALIEMFTGGQKAVQKHLTPEVQALLAKSGVKGRALLASFDSFQKNAGSGLQVFDSGPVLLALNPPDEQAKLEVRVESDDLSGDEDTLTLSPHMVRDGSGPQAEDWEAFLSNFTVNMKKLDGIWRLNKITVGFELEVGNPEFLKRTFLQEPEPANKKTVITGSGVEAKSEPQQPTRTAQQLVTFMAFMEYSFAHQHPEQGFTCSLSDLAGVFGQEQAALSGSVQGYKLSLTGCQGKPVGSFQIIAEPLAQGGGQAFCTDATRNIRVADDGSGSTCFAAGRVLVSAEESVGVDMIAPPPPPKD